MDTYDTIIHFNAENKTIYGCAAWRTDPVEYAKYIEEEPQNFIRLQYPKVAGISQSDCLTAYLLINPL